MESVSVKEALDKAYANRPDFQAAKARMIAAQLTVRAAKAERYPTLTASGYYGDRRSAPHQQLARSLQCHRLH